MQKLYHVHTKKESEFRKTLAPKYYKKERKVEDYLNEAKEKEKFKKVYLGKLDTCEEFVLFVRYLMGCLPETALKAQDMSTRWYILGRKRLEAEMNIVKIIKSLRTLNIREKPSRETKAQMILD